MSLIGRYLQYNVDDTVLIFTRQDSNFFRIHRTNISPRSTGLAFRRLLTPQCRRGTCACNMDVVLFTECAVYVMRRPVRRAEWWRQAVSASGYTMGVILTVDSFCLTLAWRATHYYHHHSFSAYYGVLHLITRFFTAV